MLRVVLDWVIDQRMSLGEAFKMIDLDMDGVIGLKDLQLFLEDKFKVDLKVYRLKTERLFKVLDLSKTGAVYLVDFEKLFSQVFKKERSRHVRAKSASQLGIRGGSQPTAYKIDWHRSCRDQIAKYIRDYYPSIEEAFRSKRIVFFLLTLA